jgi:hypothetical protein
MEGKQMTTTRLAEIEGCDSVPQLDEIMAGMLAEDTDGLSLYGLRVRAAELDAIRDRRATLEAGRYVKEVQQLLRERKLTCLPRPVI